MKDKIIEILINNIKATPHDFYPTGIEGIPQSARQIEELFDSEIVKALEFEALCNPDIYEASANEHFEQEYKGQNQVIEILKGHVDDLQEQLSKKDIELSFTYGQVDELREQLSKRDEVIKTYDKLIGNYCQTGYLDRDTRTKINKLKAEL